jgi:hypothetical protein
VEHEWGQIYTQKVPGGKFKERVIWEDASVVERINVQLHLREGDIMKLTFLIFLWLESILILSVPTQIEVNRITLHLWEGIRCSGRIAPSIPN